MGSLNSKTLSRKGLVKFVEKSNAAEIIHGEYQELISKEDSGTSSTLVFAENFRKSKPAEEEFCFEHTRVIISDETRSFIPTNASYIDGFKDPHAYIATRTPDSKSTTEKFWRMIWRHKTEIIVMLDRPEENWYGASFWNPDTESSLQFGKLNIKKFKSHQFHSSFDILRVEMTHEDGGKLQVNYFLFKDWQRHDEAPLECKLIDLIFMIRLYNQSAVTPESLKGFKSPIVIHCSDGLQRSMVFCAVDIGISAVLEKDKVNLYSIVSKLRKERYNCLHDVQDYGLCYLLLCYYCAFYM